MTTIRYGAKAGAVLFMLGLWASGAPAGVAVADDTGTADTSAAVASPARSAAGDSRQTGLSSRAAASSGGNAARRGARRSVERATVADRSGSARSAAVTAMPRTPLNVRAERAIPGMQATQTAAAAPAIPVAAASTSAPASRAVRHGAVVAVTGVAAAATPAPSTPVAEVAVNAAVRQLFNTLINFAQSLPPGDVASFLEGGLLLLRRSLFNQAPRITPSPQTTSDEGKIQGRIGAFDLEGDTLSYIVTSAPQHGTVEIDAAGSYTYSPDTTYGGSDSFTVRITPQSRSLNLLDLGSDGSRDATINIGGSNAYDAPDIAVNLSDTAGRITIQQGLFGRLTGTVTLTNLTDDTRAVWLDTAGGYGGITVKDLAAEYPAFKAKAAENGATMDLHLSFVDADNTQKALVLNNVEVSRDTNGSYVFTGGVAPDVAIEKTAVDVWDVTGKTFKALSDAFRATYNLAPGPFLSFSTVEVNFSGGDFYLDTITPLSYQQAGLYAQDTESKPVVSPSSASSPAPAVDESTPFASLTAAKVAPSPVSAALSVGQSVYIGRQNGTVEVWTSGSSEKVVLAGLTDAGDPPWGNTATGPVAVTSLTEYDRELLSEEGQELPNTFTGYIRGDVLTVTGMGFASQVAIGAQLIGPGVTPGTIVTEFIPRTVKATDCPDNKTCNADAAGGGVAGLTGTYRLSVTQSQSVGEDVSTSAVPAGVEFTQKTLSGQPIAATSHSVIVGLSNGSIQMYSPSLSVAGIGQGGWTELHPFESGWGAVKTVMPYLDGFVVGLDNGAVRQWTGPTSSDPSTWKTNWELLYAPGSTAAPRYDGASMTAFNANSVVTAMMPFLDRPEICPGDSGKGACAGFLVGRADGSVLKYNEGADGVGKPGWQTLFEGSQNSPVVGIVEYKKLISGNNYLPSFAFALKNGFIGEWKYQPIVDGLQLWGYGVYTAAAPGKWGSAYGQNEITSIAQTDRGYVVGLLNSSVQWRDAANDTWTELRDAGWNGYSIDRDQPVTTIIPFKSNGVTASDKQGVIVGLGNGSVFAWTGQVTGTTGQNDWIQLHGKDWQSAVTSIVPVTGSAINVSGDAVTRDGVMVGFANGMVQQWSGTASRGKADGWISTGGQPAVFSGSVTGEYFNGGVTLTVDTIDSGEIQPNDLVTALAGGQYLVTGRISGAGGAGTYSLFPFGGSGAQTGNFVGGSSGTTLIVNLPAAYQSGGLDPASLVGSTVTGPAYSPTVGTGVRAGMTITAFNGILAPGQASYTVSQAALVPVTDLTISGLPLDGQSDWIQLEAAPPNSAKDVLGPVPGLADFACDSSTWRCTQSGTLQQAVEFGKQLQSADLWQGKASEFGTKAGVGSALDPIFGNAALQPNPDSGTVVTLGFSKEFSPSSLNYTIGGSDPIDFKGSVSVSTSCPDGAGKCGILEVKAGSVTTEGKTVADITEGMTLEPGTFYSLAGLKSTTIGKAVPNKPGQFYLDGFVPDVDLAANIDTRLADMSVAGSSPDLKVGIDINPLAYGYVVIPDGFFPKFKPGSWSLGVLLAAEIGPSIQVRTSASGPEKDISLLSIRQPGPLLVDSFILDAGAKLETEATVNGLDKDSAIAYAYAVPGILFTYNTESVQGKTDLAFNYYLDVNASDFKSVTGVTATATLTPYIKLLYGIVIPSDIWVVGGWSLFTLSAGFENPLTATFCADRSSSCPTADADTGATASLSFGSSGALDFHAGLLDGITSALTYERQVSLYQTPTKTTVLV